MAEWNQCWYCGKVCSSPKHESPHRLTVDHVNPQCFGSDGKMVSACKHCNNLKGQSSLEEYRSYLRVKLFYGEQMGWEPW